MERIPENCPHLVEKGKKPQFIGFCSGYTLPNAVCDECKVFYKNYWRVKYGEREWEEGMKRESYVRDLLRKKFPQLSVEFTGFGAGKEKWIKLAPHEKGEPDITVSLNDKVILFVEVTGSYIVQREPNDIWIRPDKFNRALRVRSEAETWFFVVYTERDFVLDIEAIMPFKDNVRVRYPKGVPERYIHVPWGNAYPKEKLFKRIAEELN